jgi:hypothetical protein
LHFDTLLTYNNLWGFRSATRCLSFAGGFPGAPFRAEDALRPEARPGAPLLSNAGKDRAAQFIAAAGLLRKLHSELPGVSH